MLFPFQIPNVQCALSRSSFFRTSQYLLYIHHQQFIVVSFVSFAIFAPIDSGQNPYNFFSYQFQPCLNQVSYTWDRHLWCPYRCGPCPPPSYSKRMCLGNFCSGGDRWSTGDPTQKALEIAKVIRGANDSKVKRNMFILCAGTRLELKRQSQW